LPQNYKIYRKDQSLGGGGVFIGIRDCINATAELWLDSSSETVWVKILLTANRPLYVCSFYRPPNNVPSPINQVNNAIAALYARESDLANLIIAGDFNTPDIVWSEGFGHVKSNPSYDITVNYSLASDYHLEQLMHENTRQNHILDLVFSTNPANISNVRVVLGISDHEAISFSFDLNPLMYEKAERKVYLYNQGDFDAIKQSFQFISFI